MQNKAKLVKTLAIVFFLVITVSVIIAHANSYNAISAKEAKEYYEESYEDHKDEEHDGRSKSSCEDCKEYKDELKKFSRAATGEFFDATQQILGAFVLCGAFYLVGDIATKSCKSKESENYQSATIAPAPIAPVPTTSFCPNCGTAQETGSSFCAVCGAPIEN